MEDLSKSLAMILPKSLYQKAQQALQELNTNLSIYSASLDEAVKIAQDLAAKDIQVLIVRGGTEFLLEDLKLPISIVSVPVTPLDVSKAIVRAQSLGQKVGVIAFPNMLPAIEAYEDISQNDLTKMIVDTEAEVDQAMKSMADDGIDVIVGGGILNQFSSQYPVETVVFDTDTLAIGSAIAEAKRILKSITIEKESAERFKTIIENIHSGLVSVDQDGFVQIFNSAAERLLGLKKESILGRKIEAVIPWLSLSDVIHSRQEELDHLQSYRNRSYIYSKIPIVVSGKARGAVAVIEDTETIRRMEEKNRIEFYKKGHYARYSFQDIITQSDKIRETIAMAKEYALSDSTILIEGETGTGKEVFAQSIHNYSSRAAGPFVAVNCAALPESLLDSELFGYVAGAFTGADRKGKQGLFEMAHMGTIFLDEISEMNPSLQGRLLRVLQEKSIMRIGDNKLLPIDVRVIAASNRNVRRYVQEGNFRVDLFYRLNVLNLYLPPIRQRIEDAWLLIDHFIKENSPEFYQQFQGFSDDDKKLLMAHHWKGNVRELQNFAERFVLFKRTNQSTQTHLSDLLDGFWPSNQPDGETEVTISSKNCDMIIQALEENEGNISKTALALGISRTTLWRRMKEYHIVV